VWALQGSSSSDFSCRAGKCLLRTGRNVCLPCCDTRVPSHVPAVELKAVFNGLRSVMDFAEFDIMLWKYSSGCERGSKQGKLELWKVVQEQGVA